MELRDFIALLKHNSIVLATGVLIGAFSGLFLSSLSVTNPGWNAEVRLVRIPTQREAALLPDGYYAIETTKIFGQRLGKLLRDKETRGAVQLPGVSFGRVERVNDRDWTLVIRGKNAAAVEESARRLGIYISARLAENSHETEEVFLFGATVSKPSIGTPFFSPAPSLFLGAVFGLMSAGLVVIGIRYFREENA